MTRNRITSLLILVSLFILPLFHIGDEYIYSKFLLFGSFLVLILITLPKIPYLKLKNNLYLYLILVYLIEVVLFTKNVFWGYHYLMSFVVVIFFGIIFAYQKKYFKKYDLLLSITGSSVIVIVYGLMQYYKIVELPLDRYHKPDPGSLLGLSNFTAHYLIIIFPVIVSEFYKKRENLISNVFGSLYVVLFFWYIILADNRAGWIALIFMLIFFLYKKSNVKEKGTVAYIVSLTVIALAVYFIFNFQQFLSVLKRSGVSYNSIEYRFHLWSSSLNMYIHNPFGVGPGDFRFDVWGYLDSFIKRMIERGVISVQYAHNEYIQFLVEAGLFFLLLFIYIMYNFFSQTSVNDKKLPEKTAVAGGLTLSFFSFPLHMPVSSVYFWSFLIGAERKDFKESNKMWFRILLLLVFVPYLYMLVNLTIAEYNSRKGISVITAKKYQKCDKYFTSAIAFFPYEPNYYYNRAICRQNLKKSNAALRDLKKVIILIPSYSQPYKVSGLIYMKSGEKEKGLDFLIKYLDIVKTPTDFNPYHFIIASALDLRKYNIAEKYIVIANKIYKDNIILKMDEMALYVYTSRLYNAFELTKELMKRNDLPVEYYILNAQLENKAGGDVLGALRDGISKFPKNLTLNLKLVYFLWNKDQKDTAKERLLNILRYNPALKKQILQDPFLSAIYEFKGGK